MSELFIKTNKFLKKFQEILKYEVDSLFQSSYDVYFNRDNAEEEMEPWLWGKPNEYYLRGAGLEYKQIFEKEHKELNDRGLFFHYCKFKTYERTYKDRLNNFIEKYEDADPVYFLQDELKEYLKPIDFQNPFKYLDSEQQNVLSYTRDRTVRFLVEQAKTIGYNITINLDEFELTMSYKIEDTKSEKEPIQEKKEEPLIDYSDSKLTEKIIALTEIGVLDFLKQKEPFNMSTNKMAEFLSLCLGEKTTSIQSYINAIINNSDQSKSPYNTTKTVEKVKQKLIQIGLRIE